MKLVGTLTMLAGMLALSWMTVCTDDGLTTVAEPDNSVAMPTEVIDLKESDPLSTDDSSFFVHDPMVAPIAYQTECDGNCNGGCSSFQCHPGVKMLTGVDGCNYAGREPGWHDQKPIPWESFAYGEYIGPHRTPHVGEYRLRVNDQLEFVYLLTRDKSVDAYRLFVGDTIQISSAIDENLNQTDITILSDGSISLRLIGIVAAAGKTIEDLQRDLNEKYSKFVKNPAIVVGVIQGDTPLNDLRDAVDARQGQGGQNRLATVAPDGTFQLPLIGSVPAVGLTLEEVRREVNSRYHAKIGGIEVTPILTQRAPRFVYVLGEVGTPGRFEMQGPTTVMQALALAQGFTPGGNVRQAVVFRRDQDWRLIATRLDISGAVFGQRPHPSDDLWLRDSDIVLIPKRPITRLSEAVDLYLVQTIYATVPRAIIWDLDNLIN